MGLYGVSHLKKGLLGTTLLIVLLLLGILNSQVYGQAVFVTLTPVDETWYIVTNGRNAKIRLCPSIECEQVTVLPNRTSIHVIGVSEGWVEILLPNRNIGYVALFLTSPILPQVTATAAIQQDCYQLGSADNIQQPDAAQSTPTLIRITCTPPPPVQQQVSSGEKSPILIATLPVVLTPTAEIIPTLPLISSPLPPTSTAG
jgi:hypothetical protein